MKMSVWVTLKDVPREYKSSTVELAESLELVLGKNRGNLLYNNQKFCIALTAGEPFPLQIEVVNLVNGKVSYIAIDYNNLPIICQHCLLTSHLVKECAILKNRDKKGEQGAWEQEKGEKKSEVEAEDTRELQGRIQDSSENGGGWKAGTGIGAATKNGGECKEGTNTRNKMVQSKWLGYPTTDKGRAINRIFGQLNLLG